MWTTLALAAKISGILTQKCDDALPFWASTATELRASKTLCKGVVLNLQLSDLREQKVLTTGYVMYSTLHMHLYTILTIITVASTLHSKALAIARLTHLLVLVRGNGHKLSHWEDVSTEIFANFLLH